MSLLDKKNKKIKKTIILFSVVFVFLIGFLCLKINSVEAANDYTLTVQVKGNYPINSTVKIYQQNTFIQYGECIANTNAGVICTFKTITNDTDMELSALFSNEAVFSKWEGACSGAVDICNFKLDSDKTVSAFFDKKINATVGGGNTNSGNNTQNQTGSGTNSGSSSSVNSNGLVPCNGAEDCGWNALVTLINRVINFILFALAVPIAAIMFAYAGVLLLTSGGDPAQKTKAKSIFTGVAIGLVLAAAAWLIVHTVLTILGYNQSWNWFGF